MTSDDVRPLKLGILPSPQYVTWAALRDVGRRVDELGFDSLWCSDHLYPGYGAIDGPIFEGTMVLAGWAASTQRVTLGLMVAAVSFRHPAVLAKVVTTLDHMSGGRAILGIGAGWSEREHVAYGLDFGTSAGVRLAWLEEALSIIDGMRVDARPSGSHRYTTSAVINQPLPVQPRLPILIGGGGERVTLRLVARYADIWNIAGSVDEVRHKADVLRRHCGEIGRDPSAIEWTYHAGPVFIRDSAVDAAALARTTFAHHGHHGEVGDLLGTPAAIAARLAGFVRLGFRNIYLDLIAPYDEETLYRLASEVRPELARLT